MSELPRLRLLLSHSENFQNLDGADARAVEKALREAAYRVVPPTLLAGWGASAVPLLRLAGPPVTFVELVPDVAEWTVANRTAYMLQQAQLIDPTYGLAAATIPYCEMCTATKHCDSTCKDIVLASGAPLIVEVIHATVTYTAKLLFSLEWESEQEEAEDPGQAA